MAYWTPPVPKRFGQEPSSHGLIFTCVHCGRHRAVSRDGALEAWGRLRVIEEVAKRTLCTLDRCQTRGHRGHHVELAPLKAKLGSMSEITRLVRQIMALKPNRKVE
ncbi:hypothetical protein [Terricaulis sp.]|uniref:hypothetical protein n=1 Tax=Terricaulis sp. TaxID=2768686 RepID=UPI002AC66D48|nr:hypothetical protein [Terricaulis sp.]MDZ4689699.1 hypothetical protein [Terricaulis sp.]